MRRWFERLPIHRKLVTLALLVTAVGLVVAMLGLSAFDVWRYRAAAADDARALAQVLAENTSAAVVFNDVHDATETLRSVRVRQVVTRACIFLPDGTLFAGFARSPLPCPATLPSEQAWASIVGVAPIMLQDRAHGLVYVERSLTDLRGRLALTALAGVLMFVFAATAAYLLAERVHAAISRPISVLATFARGFGRNAADRLPDIRTAPDELGDLVTSFGEMLARVRAANDDVRAANEELTRSNEALRRENDERRRVEREREQALAREREASRLKDEFLAAVSHELRTPLNAMVGWAQVLAGTNPDEETARRAVASIVRNAQAQTRVIEDLIDVSRIVTGKLRLTVQQLDLRAVAVAALEAVEPAASAKGVRLERTLPDEACWIAGDRDRLQQVVWNLLSNAIKFTPKGGTVSIALGKRHDGVQLQVSDTGIGIPPSFLTHVFDRFRQADGSMTREHGGLGLGLAIVKELTELHGGSVAARSEGSGCGATFTVTLPVAASQADVPARLEPQVPPPLPSLAGARAVVVDDNVDAVELVAGALAEAGARVFTFTAAAEALRAWEQTSADVLICDLAMPQMNGLDLLERIRRLDSARGSFTPAIAVTAHASEQHRARSLEAGFQAHLPKPLQREELVRAVARALAQA